MKKMCLIDASGYIHRAYHALPPLTNSRGEMVNAVYGFARMIQKLLKSEKPDYLGVCFDTAAPTFRHQEFKEYKANREEHDDTLVSQFPLVNELTDLWGLPSARMDGFEADDVIATLAKEGRKAGCQVLILSGDKDTLQLVTEGVVVRDEIRRVDFDEPKVVEKFGIKPNQLVDYLSLMGDKIDNLSGVPGVGEKTAQKLMAEFGSLDALFADEQKMPEKLKAKLIQYKEKVFKNRELITLKSDVPLSQTLNDLIPQSPKEMLGPFLRRMEFKENFRGDSDSVESRLGLKKNETRKVEVVLDEAGLAQLAGALQEKSSFSFDLETDGLNVKKCGIVGMSIAYQPDLTFYIPLGHHYLGAPKQLEWEEISRALSPLFLNDKIQKSGHNLKFDNAILNRHGMEIKGPQFDTMVAAYCLDPSKNSFGLKNLVADEFGEQMTNYAELMKTTQAEDFTHIDIDTAAQYAGADAETTFRLKLLYEEKLKEKKLTALFYDLEMPLVEVIQAMEKAGILIDIAHLTMTQGKFTKEKASIQKEIFALAGEEFLLDSPKQLSRILFEKLKLPAIKKTKTGFSTDEGVLTKLSKNHPICAKIISYRELAKLISTYVDSLLELADPQTSRVHTSFHQTGTITGRFSSSNPNMQNIPVRSEQGREIKKAFIAPEGRLLLSADYSQIDLRALAHVSEDPVLIETFAGAGDVHTETASRIFHVPAAEVSPEMRQRAKAINFGIVYGQQAFGLSQSLGLSMEEAQNFINKYFERYAGVKKWIDATLENVRKTGEVHTLAGRRRPVPEINSSNGAIRGFAERVSINTPIQGTSADIIKAAMIRIHRDLKVKNFKTLMMVQVHDELLFEVPESEWAAVVPLIKDGMEHAFELKVPLVADLKKGKNWSEMERVIPAEAGIQSTTSNMDPRFRGGDANL